MKRVYSKYKIPEKIVLYIQRGKKGGTGCRSERRTGRGKTE